jgi:hypothetical protein
MCLVYNVLVAHFYYLWDILLRWAGLLAHVARYGLFDFAICSHTLEDLAFPQVALRMLGQVKFREAGAPQR